MKRNTLLAYGCTALLLSACGPKPPAGTGGTGTETPTPVTGTVSGKLVDINGSPVGNSPVMLMSASRQGVVKTDASGTFSFPDVPATYDLAIVTSNHLEATVYKGFTSRTLTLLLNEGTADVPTSRSAILKGAFSGGQAPYNGTNVPAMAFSSPQGGASLSDAGNTSTSYTRTATWSGATSLTGSLYALQSTLDTSTGLPTGFPGYGRRDNVTLTDGATVSAQDIPLAAVANASLNLDFTLPTGSQLLGTNVSMVLPNQSALPILGQNRPSGTSFSYVVPQVPQATFTVVVGTTEASKGGFFSTYASAVKQGLTAGSTTTLALPDFARPLEPAEASVGVTHDTRFSWSAVDRGLYTVQIKASSSSPDPYSLVIITADTQTSMPDLSAMGFPLSANVSHSWLVQFSSLVSTVDGVLDVTTALKNASQYSTSASAPRTFTTASTP